MAQNEDSRQQLQQITGHLEDLKLYIQQHLSNATPSSRPLVEDSMDVRSDRNLSRPLELTDVPKEPASAQEQAQDAEIEATLQLLDGRQKKQKSLESLRLGDQEPTIFHVNVEVNLRKIVLKKRRLSGPTEYQLMHTFSSDREDLIAAKALRIGYYVHKTDLPPFSTTQFKKEDCHPLVRIANLLIGIKEGWIWSSYAKMPYSVPCSSHYYGFMFTRIRYEDLIGATIDQLGSVKWPLKHTFELSIIPCPAEGCACRNKKPGDDINYNRF